MRVARLLPVAATGPLPLSWRIQPEGDSVQKPLRLALIGMSGAGKSYWAQKLAGLGWPAVCCDEQIERRLQPRLHAGGFAGINGVAAWMGWPDSPAYAEREAQYLAAESHVLDELLCELERDAGKSLILDTTGSVVYTGNHLLFRLRRQMTIVYLDSSHGRFARSAADSGGLPRKNLIRGGTAPMKFQPPILVRTAEAA